MNLSIYRYALEANNATRPESKEQGFQAPKTNTCRHYLVCNSRDVCRGDSRVSRSLSIYTQQILEQQSGRTQQNTHGFCTQHTIARARAVLRRRRRRRRQRRPSRPAHRPTTTTMTLRRRTGPARPLRGGLVSFRRD